VRVSAAISLFVLAINILAARTASASSETRWICYPPRNSSERDPIVRIEVAYSTGTWTISHFSQSGRHYERSSQYRINDSSTPKFYSWRGQLIGFPHLTMVGDLTGDVRAPIYSERLYDQHKDGAQVFSTSTPCNLASSHPMRLATAHGPSQCKAVSNAEERIAYYDNLFGTPTDVSAAMAVGTTAADKADANSPVAVAASLDRCPDFGDPGATPHCISQQQFCVAYSSLPFDLASMQNVRRLPTRET
jgi:hypothetical protein